MWFVIKGKTDGDYGIYKNLIDELGSPITWKAVQDCHIFLYKLRYTNCLEKPKSDIQIKNKTNKNPQALLLFQPCS